MYEAFFGLRERPFAAACRAERYFAAGGIETARQNLSRCIERAEGVGVIIGRSGTGKTLLCQKLLDQLRGEFVTALLASGRICTRRALLQAILFELGLPYRGLEEGELRLSLMDHLSTDKTARAGLFLAIDEAHTLPLRLLEELRMLTNLARDGQPRVRLLLAGSHVLEEHLANPKLDSFTQRIATRCYLEPLGREETLAYVRAQIIAAGGDPNRIFEPEALERVYQATDGVPRLINQLCDHALILANLGGQRPLKKEAVEEAWSDLQQLPTPWSETTTGNAASKVIEFGTDLDEPASESLEAIPFYEGGQLAPASDPMAQVHRIEQHLSALADDFQPVGSIGPEAELSFDTTGNPFGERFAEEEVVLDRYALLGEGFFERRPHVASREGHELSELIRALSASGEPKLSIRPTDAESLETLRGVASAGKWPADQAGHEDDDLIVLEEDLQVDPGVVATPPPLVHRQEYRQLFAKLRRS